MKKEQRNSLLTALCALAAFTLWTVALGFVDVQAIGPRGSCVGFATLNGFVHDLTGVHMGLYTVTDWLGLVPVAFGFGFAILGLIQWIRRKKIWTVDRDILVLGGFYLLVLPTYLLFEKVVINYRPVLINGILEASYPSSTTLLVTCVMPSSAILLNRKIKNSGSRKTSVFLISIFTVFMVIARLVSGVHWLTDIIGGLILSAGLVLSYYSLTE
jgi:undecaprenyl-diphosphatase